MLVSVIIKRFTSNILNFPVFILFVKKHAKMEKDFGKMAHCVFLGESE